MYNVDPSNGDIVINGFGNGIGDSPYTGITDLKSININGIPNEAGVNFSTSSVTLAPALSGATGSTVSTSGGLLLIPTSLNVESYQWVIFSNVGTSTGISTNTPYFLFFFGTSGLNYEYQLFTSFLGVSPVTIGTGGTVIFSTISPTTPKFIESMNYGQSSSNFMLDDAGRVWTDNVLTGTGGGPNTGSWVYTGNTLTAHSHGNGMVYWRAVNNTSPGDWDGYLFIFEDDKIDYSNVNGVNAGVPYNHVGTWVYGWNPATHSTGQTGYLTGTNLTGCPHNAIVGYDGRVYFCDYYNIRKFFQTDLVTPTNFSPTNAATYTYNTYNLLPIYDIATCISPLGTNMLIGGAHNLAYTWDTTSNLISQPIPLAESYVAQIITVNVNAYIFCGNRGNIYITNGSQADPWAKIPDHLSGTIEPYFLWGGAAFQKDRLYFGVYAATNAGVTLPNYGGLWEIDLKTKAISLSNELSYGTYTGYPTALYSIPSAFTASNIPNIPVGVGMFIGWVNSGTFGIDKTVAAPYTAGQSYVISDMIPIGTFLDPQTPLQFEYKLSTPLLTGETVEMQVASSLNGSFTSVFIKTGDGTSLSGNSSENTVAPGSPIQELQWILVKTILTAKSSGSSLCQLTELRIIGATVSHQMQSIQGIT